MKHFIHYDSPIGSLIIVGTAEGICSVLPPDGNLDVQSMTEGDLDLLNDAATQLDEYFSGNRKDFDLLLSPSGTEFQRKVWAELCRIPYGETRSYGQIAAGVGNPGGSRAVGMANNRNPIMIVIPCHRVVGSDGSLTGYAAGVDKKELLLSLEKRNG